MIGWSVLMGIPVIATDASKNPCHAGWPYNESSLSPLGGPDWTDKSRYKPGDTLRFRWDGHNNLHYRDGTILDALIDIAHIEPGDWYVSFLVPDGTWRFNVVVNERDFLV